MPNLLKTRGDKKPASEKIRKSILWKITDFPPRFQEKVSLTLIPGCWIWIAGVRYHYKHQQYRYAVYAVDGADPRSAIYAHRFAYEFVNGHVLPGLKLDIDHICKNKLCVNPAHLRAITHQDNCRLRNKRKRVPGSTRWLREKYQRGEL